jgi:protein phosphatase methylesterase 1
MESVLNNRPKNFKSYEQAIQWTLNTSQLKNPASARVSIPPQLKEVYDDKGTLEKLVWRVDLKKTEQFWMGKYKIIIIKGWFKGLTSSFLNIRIPKILVLAERERMDKDLTVAQMQGKFRLVVLHDTGHSVMEDDPTNMAMELNDFLSKFRVPTTMQELASMKLKGIGSFHPNVKSYTKNK